MFIRKSLAAVAVMLAAAFTLTAATTSAEAGGKRAHRAHAAKAAPAPAAHAGCPLHAMMSASTPACTLPVRPAPSARPASPAPSR